MEGAEFEKEVGWVKEDRLGSEEKSEEPVKNPRMTIEDKHAFNKIVKNLRVLARSSPD